MFILTPIAIIAIHSFLTSKRAHVCSLEVIVASVVVFKDSSNFSSICSVRVPNRQREGKKIVVSILLSTCETNFSLQKHYFANPNGENVKILVPKVVYKFRDDPTVEESRNVVILGHVLGICGKKESSMQGILLSPHTLSKKPRLMNPGLVF